MYQFGFNGKENDKEVEGWQDYGFREYDRRIARFITPDPLFKKFPMLSTYQFASNTPIWCIDLDGLEAMWPQSPGQGGLIIKLNTEGDVTSDDIKKANDIDNQYNKGQIVGTSIFASFVVPAFNLVESAVNAAVQYATTGSVDIVPLVLNNLPLYKNTTPVAKKNITEVGKTMVDAGYDQPVSEKGFDKPKIIGVPNDDYNKKATNAIIDIVADATSKVLGYVSLKTGVTEAEKKVGGYLFQLPTQAGGQTAKEKLVKKQPDKKVKTGVQK